MAFKQGWVEINSVPTKVKTWGGWIEDDLESDTVLIWIPGNPGITDFYEHFLSNLYCVLGIPVWILCYAGQEIPPRSTGLTVPPIAENEDLYNLAGQSKHKKVFIEKYVPKSKKIILVGHSMGGKMSVEIMKEKDLAEQITKLYLFCTTLHSFKTTTRGQGFFKIAPKAERIACRFAFVFGYLPRVVNYWILKIFFGLFRRFNLDSCFFRGVIKLFNIPAVKCCFFLGLDGIKNINEIDHEVFKAYHGKINIFYGVNDGWTEPNHYQLMKECYPQVRAEFLDAKYNHRFMIDYAKEMSDFLANDIQKQINN